MDDETKKTIEEVKEQMGQTLAGVREVKATAKELREFQPQLQSAMARLDRFEMLHGGTPEADKMARAHRAAWGLQRGPGSDGAFQVSLHDVMKEITGIRGDGWSKAGFSERWSDEFRADPDSFRDKGIAKARELDVDLPGHRAANMTAGVNTQGGYFIAEDWASEIIEALRPAEVMGKIGVSQTQVPPGSGMQHYPREDGSPTGYWVTEGVAPTSSGVTAGDVVATPKYGAILIKVTEQLLRYSTPSVENYLRRVMARELGLLKALAFFRGAGSSGEPTGLNILSGVDTTTAAIGANGGAITYDALRVLERAYMAANARGENIAWVMNSNLQNRIARLTDDQSRPLLVSPDFAPGIAGPMPKQLFGYPVHLFNSLPSNLTKGEGTGLTECFLGDFSYAEEIMWSQMEIVESGDASDGTDYAMPQRLRFFLAYFAMDWKVDQPAAFSAILDATA